MELREQRQRETSNRKATLLLWCGVPVTPKDGPMSSRQPKRLVVQEQG
jgi:hypothetical protein